MIWKTALAASLAFISTVRFAGADAFRLKDGTILIGEVQSRSDSGIVIKTAHLGLLRVDPGDLSCTGEAALAAASCSSERVMGDPEDHSLFFLPTAFTPPGNTGHFKDLELYFLNFGFSPTASTQLTGGFLFPITLNYQYLSAAVKQRLFQFDTDSSRTAIAVQGELTHPTGDASNSFAESYGVTLAISHRATTSTQPFSDAIGIHALIGYSWAKVVSRTYSYYPPRETNHWKSQLSLGAGTELRLTKHVKAMAEYMNAAPLNLYADNQEFEGMVTFGIRIHGAKLAADIAAIRPLTSDDLGSIFVWPLLTISYRIGN